MYVWREVLDRERESMNGVTVVTCVTGVTM